MKIQVLIGMALLTLAACTKTAKIETDLQKQSYFIGSQIGQDMKTRGMEIESEALAVGFKEAFEGKENRLKPEQQQEIMNKLRADMMKKMTEQAQSMKAQGEASKKAGEEYLAKNKGKKGVKVTASGLQYEVLEEGTGKKPKKTDTVQVEYTGTLVDGTKFDSSKDHGDKPAEFPVGQVIPGWTEALMLMKEGASMRIVLPSTIAYGPAGSPPKIPPDSVLIFEVKLVKIL